MRFSPILGAVVAPLLITAAARAGTLSPRADPDRVMAPKGAARSVPAPIHLDQGGDTIASALLIPSMPFADTGTTAGYADDYAPSCAAARGAPDVAYRFAPPIDGDLAVSLCGSSYDTAVYVFQDAAGSIIDCNDDYCQSQSRLNCPVLAGHTYYIVVDGYGSDAGPYRIDADLLPPCVVECPPGSVLEGEPVCHDDYRDTFNSGCAADPPIFSSLECSPTGTQTVCGTYGGYYFAGLSYRDTDWYQIVIPPGPAASITWQVRGESDTITAIIDGRSCAVTSFYDYDYGPGCTDLTTSGTLGPGTWWFWVGTFRFGAQAGPCGQTYVATLSGLPCPPLSVEPGTAKTWGMIKSLYR